MAFKDSLRGWNKIPFYLEQRGRGQAAFQPSPNREPSLEGFGDTNFTPSPLSKGAYNSNKFNRTGN